MQTSSTHSSSLGFCAKALAAKSHLLWRVDGIGADGLEHWYYVLLDEAKIDAFKRALKSGETINPYRYGKVIAGGLGETPSREDIAHMESLGFKLVA